MASERFILMPGLGADERLLLPQRTAGLDFEVPALPIPDQGESLTAYASRIRDQIKLDGPCVVGGVSFGGMIACELARQCDCRALILISSCRSPAVLPRRFQIMEVFSRLIPDMIARKRCILSGYLIARAEKLTDSQRRQIVSMSNETPVKLVRRGARMIFDWTGLQSDPCPVYHIHGARDPIIPSDRVSADTIVSDGGHLINLTHARTVNEFIVRHLYPAARMPVSA